MLESSISMRDAAPTRVNFHLNFVDDLRYTQRNDLICLYVFFFFPFVLFRPLSSVSLAHALGLFFSLCLPLYHSAPYSLHLVRTFRSYISLARSFVRMFACVLFLFCFFLFDFRCFRHQYYLPAESNNNNNAKLIRLGSTQLGYVPFRTIQYIYMHHTNSWLVGWHIKALSELVSNTEILLYIYIYGCVCACLCVTVFVYASNVDIARYAGISYTTRVCMWMHACMHI